MGYKSQKAWEIDLNSFPKEGSMEEKFRFVLKFAILAPSTHNSQPWLFKIENQSCKIFLDPKLKLPEGDPTGRDLYMSFGCMIENLVTASEYFGIFDRIEYSPTFGDEWVATVFVKPSEPKKELESLVSAMLKRFNARGLFESKDVPAVFFEKLKTLSVSEQIHSNFITDRGKIKQLAELTAEGLRIAYRRKGFRREVSKWMTSSLSRRLDGLPGYALRMPFVVSFILPTLVKYVDIGKRLAWLNFISVSSAPAICIMSSEDRPQQWVEVGRLSERYFLHAYAEGLKTSIFVASVEMGDLYKKVQEMVGTPYRPQFLFCLGYMNTPQRHTPRHPVEAKFIESSNLT